MKKERKLPQQSYHKRAIETATKTWNMSESQFRMGIIDLFGKSLEKLSAVEVGDAMRAIGGDFVFRKSGPKAREIYEEFCDAPYPSVMDFGERY